MTDRFSQEAAGWDAKPGQVERAVTVAAAMRDALGLRPGTSAIEIGAGTGLVARTLDDVLGPVTVTDAAPGMVTAATAALADARYAGWRATRYDIEHDPVPTDRYALAFAVLALHHMGDIPAVIRAMFTLLASGGQIALADLDHDPEGGFHRHVHDFDGHHGFDRLAVTEWLAEAGFVDVRVTTAGEETRVVDDIEQTFPVFLATGRRPS